MLNGLDVSNAIVLLATLVLLAWLLAKFGFIDAGRIVIISIG